MKVASMWYCPVAEALDLLKACDTQGAVWFPGPIPPVLLILLVEGEGRVLDLAVLGGACAGGESWNPHCWGRG